MVFQFLIALDFASHYMHMYRGVLSQPYLPLGSSFRLLQLTRHWFAEQQTRYEQSQPYPMVLVQRLRESVLAFTLEP